MPSDSESEAKNDLEVILLLQPPKYWDYGRVPSRLVLRSAWAQMLGSMHAKQTPYKVVYSLSPPHQRLLNNFMPSRFIHLLA